MWFDSSKSSEGSTVSRCRGTASYISGESFSWFSVYNCELWTLFGFSKSAFTYWVFGMLATRFLCSDCKSAPGLGFRICKELFPRRYLRSRNCCVDDSVTAWCVLDKVAGLVYYAYSTIYMYITWAVCVCMNSRNYYLQNQYSQKFRLLKI